jgi:hypothetical protein
MFIGAVSVLPANAISYVKSLEPPQFFLPSVAPLLIFFWHGFIYQGV